MIKRHLQSIESSISVGFSGSEIHVAIKALHDSGGESFARPEIVYNQRLVLPHALGELLYRIELGAHRLEAPFLYIPASPMRTAIAPQSLERLLEQVRLHAFEVVLKHVLQPGLLLVGEILRVLGEAVLGMLEHFLEAFALHPPRLLGPDLAERLVQVGHDMEAVEDVHGGGNLLLDDFEVRLPHVRADVADGFASPLAELVEECPQGFDGPLFGDVEKASAAAVDLVDQSNVVMSLALAPLVHSDRFDALEIAMLQAVAHHSRDGAENRIPTCMEGLGDLLPAQPARPLSQEQLVGLGDRALALSPRNALDLDPAGSAMHAPHAVLEIGFESPDRYEIEESALVAAVVAGGFAAAARADGLGAFARLDLGDDAQSPLHALETDAAVNKTLEPMARVEQGLQLHRRFLVGIGFTPYDRAASVSKSSFCDKTSFFSKRNNSNLRSIGRSEGQVQYRIKSPARWTERSEFMPKLNLLAA